MCGIAGIIGQKCDDETLQRMSKAMLHRGPDDEGFYKNQSVNLIFRRLAIIDIETGHQPMRNETGDIIVIFNGEIYNHKELRKQLLCYGHIFKTDHSDTEVIVHGYEQWGFDVFNKLNGMFAIAIWDSKKQKLILARDRYGIKPLYYSLINNNTIIFASEIKTILASNLVKKSANPNGIIEYFSFQNLWHETTMFSNINQLEAASIVIFQNNQIKHEKFWDITFPRSRTENLATLAQEHRAILERVVKRQLAADVPVTTYLSGGIDSTAITLSAHKIYPEMKAYSCIFDLENVVEQAHFDEREYSELVAKTYEINRIEYTVSPQDLINNLDKYVYALEDLRMGMGYVNYLVAGRVAQDAKVVLSGTGGDEYHAGYVGRYDILGLANTSQQSLVNRFKSLILKKNKTWTDQERHQLYSNVLNAVYRKSEYSKVFNQDFISHIDFDPQQKIDQMLVNCPSSHWYDKVFYVDAKTYLTGLLTFEDKVSMAHSLETRVPLLDNELVDFLLDVPFEYLCNKSVGKILFRESVKPLVPEKIYKKPKMGFGPPDADWYRHQLKPWIQQQLSVSEINKHGIFNANYVETMLNQHFNGQANNTYLIWSLLNFQSWCKQFNT